METHLRDVPVVWHSAENVDTAVEWSDLLSLEFLVSGSRYEKFHHWFHCCKFIIDRP